MSDYSTFLMNNMFHEMVKPVKKAIRKFGNGYHKEVYDDILNDIIDSGKAKNKTEAKKVFCEIYKNPELSKSPEYLAGMLAGMENMYMEMSYVFD